MQAMARICIRVCVRLVSGATKVQGIVSLVLTFYDGVIQATVKRVCAYRGAWVNTDGYDGSVRALPSVAEEHAQCAAAHGGERYHKHLRMQGWR